MKQTYVKPKLYAEEFVLAEHISDCTGIPPRSGMYSHNDGGSCTLTIPGYGVLFNHEGCQMSLDEGSPITCYEAYAENMIAFGS